MIDSIQARAARDLYENLGKLFYAVAAADKVISKQEVQVLNEIVEKDWLPVEDSRDEYGTDLSFQIEVIFDWYQENNLSAEMAYERFETFKKSHEWLFDEDLNDLIWKTVNKIALAFPGKNRSEVLMLIRLKSLLHIHHMVSQVCQSCGQPLQEENMGTNRNLSPNEDYCMACFKNGEFLDHSLTLHKLTKLLQERAEKHNEISFEESERLKKVLPTLKRWRLSSI
ncbi:zinc ribbon domain-containing protein [Salinimicrobium sp. GXAS 041]|uniref:zinc ribbon domain-containing protein n=1 Tax=Salinimicrobium sp. GXAS 041 TaxID=3400806 RepID=UPI003C716F31